MILYTIVKLTPTVRLAIIATQIIVQDNINYRWRKYNECREVIKGWGRVKKNTEDT